MQPITASGISRAIHTMTFRLRLAAICFALIAVPSACQPPNNIAPVPTEITPEPTAEVTEAAAAFPEWIEEYAGGIEIGMWKPIGWSVESGSGVTVTLLQHDPIITGGQISPESGIIVNIFSPDLARMNMPETPEGANQALWLLDYVVSTPGLISGLSTASDPQEFLWNGYDAAYYLLSGPHYKRGIVICVTVALNQIVGINIAMPHDMAGDVRQFIPQLFDDFTAADIRLDSDDLSSLPDPLVFPERNAEHTAEPYGG